MLQSTVSEIEAMDGLFCLSAQHRGVFVEAPHCVSVLAFVGVQCGQQPRLELNEWDGQQYVWTARWAAVQCGSGKDRQYENSARRAGTAWQSDDRFCCWE